MAGRLIGAAAPAQRVQCPTDGATAITRGALIYVDPTVVAGGVVRIATGAAEATTSPALFVANATIAATATSVLATLVTSDQLWEWDCAADTAATQDLKRHNMSTSLLLDNTATDDATIRGVWTLLYRRGAAADRFAICKANVVGAVTA